MGSMRIKPVESVNSITKIKVVGIGGGGGNTINYMIEEGIDGVEFIAINTDAQDLKNNKARKKVQIGEKLTGGRGAGGQPEIGEQAAKESTDKIKEELQGAQMIFLTAGMGGGTGTGASPIVAQIAKELDILTVAVVTLPFPWENRDSIAEEGVKKLKDIVNSIIIIPNERLSKISKGQLTIINAFKTVNEVLYNAVKGISDLIVAPGYINVDFADVKSVMKEGGVAVIGTGYGEGDNKIIDAIEEAINNPIVESSGINGAKGVLINFVVGEDVKIDDLHNGATYVSSKISKDAFVKFGLFFDESLNEAVKVTIIATGFSERSKVISHTVVDEIPVSSSAPPLLENKETVNWNNTPGINMFTDDNFDKPTFQRDKEKKKGLRRWLK